MGTAGGLLPRHFGVPTALYKWISVALQIRRKLSDPSPPESRPGWGALENSMSISMMMMMMISQVPYYGSQVHNFGTGNLLSQTLDQLL